MREDERQSTFWKPRDGETRRKKPGGEKIRRRKVVLFVLGSSVSCFGTRGRSSIVALIGLMIGSR